VTAGDSFKVIKVGVDREVDAARERRYYTRWTNPVRPKRPDGNMVIKGRVVDVNGVAAIPELVEAEVLDERADWWAWFDRWWGSRWRRKIYDGTKSDGEAHPPDWVRAILDPVLDHHGSRNGIWDAVAIRYDGSVSFAEVKRYGADRLRPNQHQFASNAKHVLGDRVSFSIIEWTVGPPLDWRELRFESQQALDAQRALYRSDAEFLSRMYRWTMWDEDFIPWVRASMPQSAEAWLTGHHLRTKAQVERFFKQLDSP
jgi:hypothetical protein